MATRSASEDPAGTDAVRESGRLTWSSEHDPGAQDFRRGAGERCHELAV